ncbi:hypothetical protein [Streptomyces sp. NPDC002057]|uniref:hypothetical protein n=1 Tax=Streptomyces sp. NPDC002057 TaxID=3154664 RepID=UPI0033209DF1
MDVWNYFEGKPELLTAVAAVIAIGGALVGAKIQANSGRAQAAAAREAAVIAAEAQRVADLWTVRQLQVAELVRGARRLFQLCERLWYEDDVEARLRVESQSEELALRLAEVELLATDDVVECAQQLVTAALRYEEISDLHSGVTRARAAVYLLTRNDDHLATEVTEVMSLHREGDPERAVQWLTNIFPNISRELIEHLVAYDAVEDDYIRNERSSAKHEFRMAARHLVAATRVMLRARDDVAPVLPRQRRRYRRNQAETAESSA